MAAQASMNPEEVIAESLADQLQSYITHFCILGCCVMVVGFVEMMLWMWTAERQAVRIRKRFFHSILKQHIGWFDEQQVGELTTRLAE